MNAETSFGSGPTQRHRSLQRVRTDPHIERGRPSPDVTREPPEDWEPRRRRISERLSPRVGNLAASFPLFFFGAGCVAASVFILLEDKGAAIGHIPLWLPFLALGAVALVGGTLSVFAEPDVESDSGYRDPSPPSPMAPKTPPRAPVRPSPTPPPEDEPVEEPPEPAPPRPQRIGPRARGMGSATPPVESAELLKPPPTLPEDTDALLQEIDRIDADLRSSRGNASSAPPAPAAPTSVPAPAKSLETGLSPAEPFADGQATAPRRSRRVPIEDADSQAPRSIATCGGCGSVVIDARSVTQCQVCGEPQCSECRERSRLEGTPNVCPLCSLLDTVHSGRPATAGAGPQRT